MPTMDVWYAHLDEDELMGTLRSAVAETKKEVKGAKKGKKEKKDQEQEKLAKRAEKVAAKTAAQGAHPGQPAGAVQALRTGDGQYRIVSQPPIIVPARDLAATYGLVLRTRSCR